MFTVVFLSLLLGAAPDDGPSSSSQSLESPPVVDDSPTAWSCTADTLRSGRECVFEAELTPSEPNKDQAASNVKTIQQLGRTLCAEAARPRSEDGKPDRSLAATCEKKYAAAATERCDLEGTVPIVDTKGRFAPAARACYRAISGVLQETLMMATVAAPCCQCAAQSGCPGAGDRCYSDLTQQKAGAATLACMRDRCADSCSLAPPAMPRKASAPSMKSEPRPSRGSASL